MRHRWLDDCGRPGTRPPCGSTAAPAGRIGGRATGGSPVLLLTVAGRKSGAPHTVPVATSSATAPTTSRRRRAASRRSRSGSATSAPPRRPRSRWVAQQMPVSVEVLRGAAREAAWNDFVDRLPVLRPVRAEVRPPHRRRQGHPDTLRQPVGCPDAGGPDRCPWPRPAPSQRRTRYAAARDLRDAPTGERFPPGRPPGPGPSHVAAAPASCGRRGPTPRDPRRLSARSARPGCAPRVVLTTRRCSTRDCLRRNPPASGRGISGTARPL